MAKYLQEKGYVLVSGKTVCLFVCKSVFSLPITYAAFEKKIPTNRNEGGEIVMNLHQTINLAI